MVSLGRSRKYNPSYQRAEIFRKAIDQKRRKQNIHLYNRSSKDLSFPDEKGEIKIEEGYFTIYAGNQSARFKLSKSD